jgi:predicted lipid carrier protein YhbT
MTPPTNVIAPTVAQIFDRIAKEKMNPSLKGETGTFEFDLDGAGQWFLGLDDGKLSLLTPVEHPDCVVHCPASTFIDIAQGRGNLIATFLQGVVKIDGNPELALDIRRFLPVAA